MKYKALILLALSATAASLHAITTTLAYEDQRETNTLAYVETNLIAAASNNLAAAIAAAEPGDYAAVSNAAMNARGKTDLAVYGYAPPAEALPMMIGGIEISQYRISDNGSYLLLDAILIEGRGYENLAFFDRTTLAYDSGGAITFNGRSGVAGSWPVLTTSATTDTLALASDVSAAATAATNYTDAAIAQIDVTETDPVYTADKTEIDSAIESAAGTASQALAYSAATHLYMTANTNSWFEGTNYVFGADATNKTHFTFEEGMDLLTMPCSLALREIRDGTRQVVWDQRDWTAWYWSFKAEQFSNTVARAMLNFETNYMQRGWSKYTARYGIDNPDPDMLWVDCVKGVTLAPGMSWQKFVDIGGAGYWTITGNADICAEVSGEDAFLTIKDFEGHAALTFRKRSAQQVYAPKELNAGFLVDSYQNAIMTLAVTNIQPIAEFSTTLESGTFVEETSDDCPVDAEWYQESNGYYSCHFRLKSGIVSESCFAKFKITLPGEDIVEYTVPITIKGGLGFEQDGTDYKIKPVVSGTTVNWVLVQ